MDFDTVDQHLAHECDDYVIKNPAMTSDKTGSYELLEAALMEYLGLLDSQSKRPIGNINAASHRAEPQAVTTEYEYSELWWDDYHGKVDVQRQ